MKTAAFSATQRWLHWIVAVMVLILLPIGFWMVDRGQADLWDGLTGGLYSTHKAMGFIVLWLVIWRLILRAKGNPPAYPSTVPPLVQRLAKSTQWVVYALLISIALLGWAGVTAFGALNTIGGLHLPAMPGIPADKALAKDILSIHGWLAVTLCVVLCLHIAGALKHKLVDRDGVFDHMSVGKQK